MLLSTVVALLQMSAVVQTDDGVLLRDARKAQIRFESFRRAHLPWDRSRGSPGSCDARIGRYCYWYDSTETTELPEPAQIGEARAKLLGLLDSAAALDPSDAWIVGQRIRYLIEGGHDSAAVEVGSRCRAERWWCAALTGLALHAAERYPEADSVFTIALAAMPGPQRCEWIDLRRMTDGLLERELSRATCEGGEREALGNTLWELSRPFWSVPGNDLRTEHLARHTMAQVLARSANGHGIAWGQDSRELLLRYGWAEWFTRDGSDIGGLSTTPRITGHSQEPSFSFFPAVSAVRHTPRLAATSWRFRQPLATTRYAPRYLKGLSDLPHQLARFPRGDSMLVAVAYRIADTALVSDSLLVSLCHPERSEGSAGDPLQIPRCARNDRGGTRNDGQEVMRAIVPRDSMIVSLEVRGLRSHRGARARYTIDPLPCATSWCLSDLVLFDASGGPTVADVDTVMPGAAAELRFANSAPLGVFWEIQGGGAAGSTVPVSLSLTVSPLRSSVARRIATRLRLAPELAPVRLRWQVTLRNDREGQLLTLQLPRNARGRYRVLLTFEPPGAPPQSAVRDIELLP